MNEERERILALAVASEGSHNQGAITSTTALLTDDNASKIATLLAKVSRLTPNGAAVYERVLETCRTATPQIANAVTLAWRHSSDLNENDRSSLRSGANLYGIVLNNDLAEMARASSAVATYLERERQKLLAEARRLQKLRLSIQARNMRSVSKTVISTPTHPTHPLDTLLSTVPTPLSPFFKKAGENELEMAFPLTNLTKRQKLGIQASDSTHIRVRLMYAGKKTFPGYCVHLSNECRNQKPTHKPWLFSTHTHAPNEQYCFGQPNLASYQLSRMLWRHFEAGFTSLEDTYNRIASNVADLAQRCVVCGTHHHKGPVRLLRPTTCSSTSDCARIFSARSFQWHLTTLWESPSVFDLLLTMVHASAQTKYMPLLPTSPIQDPHLLIRLISTLPPIDKLADQLLQSLTTHPPKTPLPTLLAHILPSLSPSQTHHLSSLLTWLPTSYAGFLTPATNSLKIPSFHPSSQFLLLNTSPAHELQFARHRHGADHRPRVLWHGTTLDRLHSILRCGLIICSATPLEQNGAVWGEGIYLTEDPMRAYNFAEEGLAESISLFPTDNNHDLMNEDFAWTEMGGGKRSVYHNKGVLLACEVITIDGDDGYIPPDIDIVVDPTRVMVRYIFLVERGGWVEREEVGPVIKRVLSDLRNGGL